MLEGNQAVLFRRTDMAMNWGRRGRRESRKRMLSALLSEFSTSSSLVPMLWGSGE